jgi:hypothetical protein
MSSATSIEQPVRQARTKPDATGKHPTSGTATNEDASIRPWHFFVLLSLIAATVAVVLSRRATPEHLIMMSLMIAAAGVAGAAFHRMLAPLVSSDVTRFSEPLTERSRAALEREKQLVLRSIKDLEFDRAMGKLSTKDFDDMSGRLRARAISLMKQLDEGPGYREAIERELKERLSRGLEERVRLKPDTTADEQVRRKPDVATCACGTANDDDALFCKRCGAKLERGAVVDAGADE